jgi:cation diffusion facilitator CzcD-associated flavoprotein CzcO
MLSNDSGPGAAPARHEVVILGAGMSGLCMAMQLLRAGRRDFVVIEQSAGLGGTWWDNRYPGAHVDVPAPLYSFSFAPNPRWSRRFAGAPEIQAYMADCARRAGVEQHCRFGRRIEAARFDEDSGRWHITLDGGEELDAQFFVCSTGPLSVPRWPAIEGLSSFAGARLHSARWDTSVPLAGRRVGVIGTGSTGSQLVPPIAEQAAHLSVFQRTPNWVLPRFDRHYGAIDHLLARLPPWRWAVRGWWAGVAEWFRRAFEPGSPARASVLRGAELHLRHQIADEALRKQLRPTIPFGCKRIIFSSDYYPALARPNVALVTPAIERVTPQGVRTADGREHPLDVLVCATGFDVEHSVAVPITGRGGRSLQALWKDGAHAHLGLTVAGFPNLFLMLGPNTATGHTSTLLFVEPGVQWVLRAMAEVQRRGARWLDVRPDVMQAFNSEVQSRLVGSVWSQCRSWYRAANGRNVAIWPGYTLEYRRRVRKQRFEDFEFG